MVEYPTNTAFPDIEKANDYLENHLIEVRDRIHSDHPSIDASELEVFTYLKSRNIDCGREVEIVAVHYWDIEYRAFINASSEYNKVDNRSKDLTIEEAEASEPLSTPVINFWNEYSDNRYSDDSYFLRFIDWCIIDDLNNIWIDRIKKEYNQLCVNKEIPTDLLSIMLFNHCRSDYSLKLFKDSLLKLLNIFESQYFEQNGDIFRYKKDFIDYQAIAIIVFANIILKTVKPKVIKKGLEILTNNQNTNGGWSVNNKKQNSDLLTSAIVIHSLALAQEPYWMISLRPCIKWIKSEQDTNGGWTNKEFGQIPLTVMILDALELAKGNTKVTFKVEKPIISNKLDIPSDKEESIDLQIQKNLHRVTHNQLIKERYKNKFKLGHITINELIEKAKECRKKNGKLNFSAMSRKFGNIDSETIKSELQRRKLSWLFDSQTNIDSHKRYERCNKCGKSKLVDKDCPHCFH